MNKRRVVITGLGAITSIGKSVPETWEAVRRGDCGIDKITLYDASTHPVQIAAEVKNFNPEDHGIALQEAKRMARLPNFYSLLLKNPLKTLAFLKKWLLETKQGLLLGMV